MAYIRAKKIGNKTYYSVIRTKFNKEKKYSEQKVIYIGDKKALRKFYEKVEDKLR